jgi:hypothetical protein
MSSQKSSRDLQELLTRSIEALRASHARREKYPALDRLLSRMEAHERRVPQAGAYAWKVMRPLAGPLVSAAAGFAGAALALLLLPAHGSAPLAAERAPLAPPALVVSAPQIKAADPAGSLSRSIDRLERAIEGLEKFQPLVESRIESLEDALQRKHADAYASGEDVVRSQSPYQPVQMRPDRGAFF